MPCLSSGSPSMHVSTMSNECRCVRQCERVHYRIVALTQVLFSLDRCGKERRKESGRRLTARCTIIIQRGVFRCEAVRLEDSPPPPPPPPSFLHTWRGSTLAWAKQPCRGSTMGEGGYTMCTQPACGMRPRLWGCVRCIIGARAKARPHTPSHTHAHACTFSC